VREWGQGRKNAAGNSLGLLSVTGLLDGAAVRARYGIGSVLAAGSRGSLVLAGLDSGLLTKGGLSSRLSNCLRTRMSTL